MSTRGGLPLGRRHRLGAVLLATALAVPACSKETLRRGSYETLHNVSDQQNEIDPKYEADRPSYEVYRQQRQELLNAPTPAGTEAPPAK